MTTPDDIFDALRDVIDPDVGINIVDLGLVETVDVAPDRIYVGLIMTTPACPQGGYMVDQSVEVIRRRLDDAREVRVDLLDYPMWQPDRMSDLARQVLGWNR